MQLHSFLTYGKIVNGGCVNGTSVGKCQAAGAEVKPGFPHQNKSPPALPPSKL